MTEAKLSDRRRLLIRGGILALLGFLAAAGLFYVAVVPPTDVAIYPKCQFFQLTGWHCPGCGMTRALHAATNGDWQQAIAYNLLAPLLLPIVVLSVARSLWSWAWAREHDPDADLPDDPPPSRWKRKYLPWVFFGTMLGFGILRNLPFYPFNLLAPHELP